MNIVITGATKGIGRAIAEKFAGNQYNILAIARTLTDLEQMQEDFAERYPPVKLTIKAVDLANPEELKNLLHWFNTVNYNADVLVNNAALYVPATINNEKEGLFEEMMQLNVFVPYKLIRQLLPSMIDKGTGSIINICSVASVKPMANAGSYGVSKWALLGLTRHLREELKDKGVKVTAVIPGSTYTSSWEGEPIDPARLVQAKDIAEMVYAAVNISESSTVEDIVIRPQKGDL